MEDNQTKVLEWLAGRDTGVSSKSLAFQFLGIKNSGPFGIDAPVDPADLGRCLRLIALVPEVRKCVDELAAVNTAWSRLAPVWDEITQSMIDEVGIDWSKGKKAPKTYELMQAHRRFGQAA